MINKLKIINGDTIKTVTFDFLISLYKFCTGQNTDSPENANLYVLSNDSNIVGHVSVNAIYEHIYQYLRSKFQDFFITYDKVVIYFKDKVLEQIICNQYGTDGTLTPSQAEAATSMLAFRYNTDITSFDELSYFKNVHNLDYRNGNFTGCTNLESIDLINITGKLSAYSFQNCSKCNFKNHNNISEISECAFDGCTKLESIDLSNLKPSQSILYNFTFRNCTALTNVILSPYVNTFYNGVFENCNLSNIDLSNIVNLGGTSLRGNNNLPDNLDLSNIEECNTVINIKNIYLPKCKKISQASWSCMNQTQNGNRIETINIPNAEDLSGGWLFCDLINLKEVHINFKQGYGTVIGAYAFGGCSNLEVFDMGDNVKELGNNFFPNCKITNLNLNKVETIGNNFAYQCTNLIYVNAPYLKTMGNSAFDRCTSLRRFNSDVDYTYDLTGITTLGQAPFIYTSVKIIILDPNLKILHKNFCWCCGSLESINVNNIEEIDGEDAFNRCWNLQTLTFDKLKFLHSYAFRYMDWEWIKITNEDQIVTLGNETTPANTGSFDRPNSYNHSHRIYVPDSLYNDYLNDASWITALSTNKATLKRLSEFTTDYGI